MELPVVVLPGPGFDVLLGLFCILKAAIRMDAERQVLLHGGQKYTFETIYVPDPPAGAICTIMYA